MPPRPTRTVQQPLLVSKRDFRTVAVMFSACDADVSDYRQGDAYDANRSLQQRS